MSSPLYKTHETFGLCRWSDDAQSYQCTDIRAEDLAEDNTLERLAEALNHLPPDLADHLVAEVCWRPHSRAENTTAVTEADLHLHLRCDGDMLTLTETGEVVEPTGAALLDLAWQIVFSEHADGRPFNGLPEPKDARVQEIASGSEDGPTDLPEEHVQLAEAEDKDRMARAEAVPVYEDVVSAALMACHPIRMAGKGLHALLAACAERPEKGEPLAPTHSVGVGDQSIAACKHNMAVVLGDAEDSYRPTQRPYAELAGDRSKRLGEAVDWGSIPTMEPEKVEQPDGPSIPGLTVEPTPPVFPPVRAAICQVPESMIQVGRFRASDLEAIGKIVGALTSGYVDLYYDGQGSLGFACECPAVDPEPFSDASAWTPTFPLRGVVKGKTVTP